MDKIQDGNANVRLFGPSWFVAAMINLVVLGYFGYALYAPASTVKATLLPGTSTHGHYQIELDCNVCHQPTKDGNDHSSQNLMQDACNRCHADQLRLANDTHPARKFNDPTNAELLLTLNAKNCLTCHREHAPEQTLASGLTVPKDYCWHCHQDVADNRPSHIGMAFDSCATAGCHNYHDNRALYEKYLDEHFGEPDHFHNATEPLRNFAERWTELHPDSTMLSLSDVDAPVGSNEDIELNSQWAETAHAAAGVSCRACHESADGSWNDHVAMEGCGTCHPRQTNSFTEGRHGMRLAVGLMPMTPEKARLQMRSEAAHKQLTCNACHNGHEFDTEFAAVDACLSCHADAHSSAYSSSPHANVWESELAGDLPRGSGVTCATCHMPRITDGTTVWVNHDQNANLRPRETMAREVCSHCHGLEFSLSSLADPASIASCFNGLPRTRTKSVQMAHDYFAERERAKKQRRISSN